MRSILLTHLNVIEITYFMTRMHSSRMRTGRSLTVCWRLLPGGGCLLPGGVGGSGLGGVCSGGGVWSGPGGVVSGHTLRQTPSPPLWTESQMPLKTLPWPNFVAAGKNFIMSESHDVKLFLFRNLIHSTAV